MIGSNRNLEVAMLRRLLVAALAAVILAPLMAELASATVEVDVVSFNIARGLGRPNEGTKFVGDKYLKGVEGLLRHEDPDLAGLQEVGRNRYETRWIDQDEWLRDRLKRNVYWVSMKDVLWGLVLKQGNAVVSKYPFVERREIHYATVGEGSGAAKEPRGAVLTAVVIGGYKIWMVSTHLGFPETARVGQVKELLAALADVREPMILVGDCNTTKGSESYNLLRGRFDDTWELAGKTVETATCGGKKKIDFIFVSKGRFTVTNTYVRDSGEASDHQLLAASLALDTAGLKPAVPAAADRQSPLDRLGSKLRNLGIR